MPIDISELIQIIIAIIMLLSMIITSFFSYLLIRTNIFDSKSEFFRKLCEEERTIRFKLKELDNKTRKIKKKKGRENLIEFSDTILFDFYENISILFFKGKIDDEMFFLYFGNIITETYLNFMDSILFKNAEERIEQYPNLCNLFNEIFMLSIKKIPEELKN